MEAMGWKHLPYTGGLLEQPEWLIEDLLTISSLSGRIKKQYDDE